MKVVNFNDQAQAKRRAELLEILDGIRKRVEDGKIEEFVAATMDPDGEVQIHACIKDVAGGVGMFEIGKHILIQQEA